MQTYMNEGAGERFEIAGDEYENRLVILEELAAEEDNREMEDDFESRGPFCSACGVDLSLEPCLRWCENSVFHIEREIEENAHIDGLWE